MGLVVYVKLVYFWTGNLCNLIEGAIQVKVMCQNGRVWWLVGFLMGWCASSKLLVCCRVAKWQVFSVQCFYLCREGFEEKM